MKSHGEVAYNAYMKYSGGRSLVSGALLPEWPDLDGNIRDAWLAAAQAVTEDFERQNNVPISEKKA